MRLEAAKNMMKRRQRGFRVSFDWLEPPFLRSDHFPERDEPLIKTEIEAWRMAKNFAAATFGKTVNIYVVDHEWMLVNGYREKMIENR